MKKIASFLLCLILILCFAGCKSNKDMLLSSDSSSFVENSAIDTDNASSSILSQEETVNNNTISSNNTLSNSTPVNSSQESKPQQTVTTHPDTITAQNGDKIHISITDGKSPTVTVKVNDKEIFRYSDFDKYPDEYNFEKEFTCEVINEYSDESILWAYQFAWGTVYSAKYDLLPESTDGDTTFVYGCVKHDYEKDCYRKIYFSKIAEQWDLVEYEIDEYTGKKYFWDSYTMAQVIFEHLYKTTEYQLTEINDLEKAGYSFENYNDMHQCEFQKSSPWQKIYEVSVGGKPFALMAVDAATAFYELQELDWKMAGIVFCKYTEDGIVYYTTLPEGTELTKIS